MAIITSSLPDFGNSKGTDEKIEVLLNSYYQLRKEIEYALQNVDFSNLSTDLANKLKKIDEELNTNASDLNSAITQINNDMGALQDAIADGLITTYYQATKPTEANVGDLWFNTSTGKLGRYNGVDYDSIEDSDIIAAVQAAQNAQTTADGKIVSFYQAEQPTEGTKGDLWIDTDNFNRLHRHNGTDWVRVTDTRIENVFNSSGKIMAEEIAGILNTAVAMVKNGNGTVTFDNRGLIVTNQTTEIASTKAVLMSSTGILIANSKDANGNWQWQTAITGDSINADLITTGTLKAINIQGVNITGSTMLIQHDDGSKTKIDGRGISRVFSVPIFTQLPSGTNIQDMFETGIANTRVDLVNSFGMGRSVYGSNYFDGKSVNDFIFITAEAKYAGTYGLKIITPQTSYDSGEFDSHMECVFLNYRPTKNTTFSMRYRVPTQSYLNNANLYIDDLDYPSIPTQTIPLTSSTWASVTGTLTAHHTYRISIIVRAESSSKDKQAYIYVDDMVYELNVNESVITGYTESEQPYYDFTYIRKGHFDATGTQQIILPDYFKGMNFDVFIMPTGDWYWQSTSKPEVIVESVNNIVPSFTVKYSAYPSNAIDFIYTIILNN